MAATINIPCYHPIVGALLTGTVLPARSQPFERVSAAMATRAALGARASPRTLLFLVPEGTSSTARYILAGIVAANHAHANAEGRSSLPPEECGAFLKNAVLLITPAVADCMADLDDLRLAGSTKLNDLWEVAPLAMRAPRASRKQRLFVANPGWATSRIADRKFSAVVIDATHPRTLNRLRVLIEMARAQSPLCVVVAPAISSYAVADLVHPDAPEVWMWDPQSKTNAVAAISGCRQTPPAAPAHPIIVCDQCPEADEALEIAYREIAAATRLMAGAPYPGLPLVYSIVNRLRALTVPLSVYEEAASRTWAGGLASRMRMLSTIGGHGSAAWDLTWPKICETLKVAYAVFVNREETAKFWVLAERLQTLLRVPNTSYRVVAPTVVEVELLTSWLQEVVAEMPDALADGRLEIVSHLDEARLVAEGVPAHTILLGPRPVPYRYLGMYPSCPHEEVLYPFEVPLEQASLSRSYGAAAAFQSTARSELLDRLQLGMLSEVASAPTSSPKSTISKVDGRSVSVVRRADVDTNLDLDELAEADSEARIYLSSGERDGGGRSGSTAMVLFKDGTRECYAVEHFVDVYYEATDIFKRLPILELESGMQVVRFVDGRYDNLFERTAEAIERKLPARSRIALELWAAAKKLLLKQFGDVPASYEALRVAGLKSSIATMRAWLQDADTIAPRHFEEFEVVARATGAFKTEKQIRDTFTCIQMVRGRRRKAGRQLHALLRAVITRDGYEEALDNVRKVDPDLADVYAAVDVAEVQEVSRP